MDSGVPARGRKLNQLHARGTHLSWAARHSSRAERSTSAPRRWGSSAVDGFLSKGLYYDKVSWPWDRVALSQHLFFLLV